MILDTCALLWLARGEHRQMSPETLDVIEQAADVHIVAITGFEISLKYAAGKLPLKLTPQKWLAKAVDLYQLNIIPLDLETCITSAALPPIHQDPCDRFIIAAALQLNMPVVTADKLFEKYGVQVLC